MKILTGLAHDSTLSTTSLNTEILMQLLIVTAFLSMCRTQIRKLVQAISYYVALNEYKNE
jgi:hypothetical protein